MFFETRFIKITIFYALYSFFLWLLLLNSIEQNASTDDLISFSFICGALYTLSYISLDKIVRITFWNENIKNNTTKLIFFFCIIAGTLALTNFFVNLLKLDTQFTSIANSAFFILLVFLLVPTEKKGSKNR